MGIFLFVVSSETQRSFHFYSTKSKRTVKFSVTAIHVHYKYFSYVKAANRAYANTAFPTQDHSSNFPYVDPPMRKPCNYVAHSGNRRQKAMQATTEKKNARARTHTHTHT